MNIIKLHKKMMRFFHNKFTAWLILGLSVSMTIAAYTYSKMIAKDASQLFFYSRTGEITQAIEERMSIYEGLLRSGIGLFKASENVTREEWKEFVKDLEVEKNWPGVLAFGYAVPIKKSELKSHEDEVRQEFPDYRVYPQGERDVYTSIIYIEPFDWRNKRALGYDMFSEPTRQEAMLRAAETGEAATSGIITLVQETEVDRQKGFLMYLPLFKDNKFKGWVYSPFRIKDLMKGVLGDTDPNIKFAVYDESKSDENLLFKSGEYLEGNLLSRDIFINVQGRQWLLHFESSGKFDSYSHALFKNSKIIFYLALFIEFLLFNVILSVALHDRG